MCPLIETIRIENGVLVNPELHQERMNHSTSDLFGCRINWEISSDLKIPIPFQKGKVKCRIIYNTSIISVEFDLYHLKPVHSLKLIHDDSIDYSYKYLDRNRINLLFSLKENADDVLIIRKGEITDTSFANIIFRKGQQWFTPLNPLLKGTKREYYIRNGIITPIAISPNELSQFEEARIINAMISIEDAFPIPISNIIF